MKDYVWQQNKAEDKQGRSITGCIVETKLYLKSENMGVS